MPPPVRAAASLLPVDSHPRHHHAAAQMLSCIGNIKKLSEGKTKKQALKCLERRLVNIIWTMLTNNEEYVNPPMIEIEKEEAEEAAKPAAKPTKKA